MAPLVRFDRSREVGWLIDNTYGEPRHPESDRCASVTEDLGGAMREGALRVHRVGVAAAVAGRRDEDWTEYLVARLADFRQLDAVGWRIRDLFLPD